MKDKIGNEKKLNKPKRNYMKLWAKVSSIFIAIGVIWFLFIEVVNTPEEIVGDLFIVTTYAFVLFPIFYYAWRKER